MGERDGVGRGGGGGILKGELVPNDYNYLSYFLSKKRTITPPTRSQLTEGFCAPLSHGVPLKLRL